LSFHFVQTRVEIASAKATLPEADALLLPTNDYLWMASGPALDLKKTAGADIEIAAVKLGPIGLGDVVVTAPGSLPVSAILHGAVMGQDLHPTAEAAARAVTRGLEIAHEKKWKRIVIHSLMTAGRRTGPDVVKAAVAALIDALLAGSTLHAVTFLAADDAERAIIHESLLGTIQKHG
jgi:O-acetyl-ADP-ribose deacetylase (regulator of RNase III)